MAVRNLPASESTNLLGLDRDGRHVNGRSRSSSRSRSVSSRNHCELVFCSFLRINNPKNEVLSRDKITRFDVPTRDNTKFIPISESEINLKLYEDSEYFFHTPYLKNVINN